MLPSRRFTCATLLAVAFTACVDAPAELEYELVGSFPHDTAAYTQGLLIHGRSLVESTGRYGLSTLRRVDIATGQVQAEVALDSVYFAEGLALVGDELFQLTWKAGIGFVYDVESLELVREFSYDGEGWGLCYDGATLYMSNGGDHLQRRAPSDFALVDSLQVTSSGISVFNLNELECVDGFVYANVFQSDRVVKIDPETGEVVGELDLSALTARTRRPADPGAVLNGIAYIEETSTFLVTGKLWPTVYAIRLPE